MSKYLKARCGGCDHVFIVCELPKPVSEVAKLSIEASKSPCPSCKQKTKLYLASSNDEPARAEVL